MRKKPEDQIARTEKIRHYGENWGQELFGELNGEFYHINKNKVIVVRPANINGCVFMMLENIIQYGIDVCYKDILYKLLDMNYMLVCIDEYPAKNLKRYKIIMEETIRFFNVSGKPFFYMGVESDGMFVTLKMDHVFKSNGMIWLCERKRKKIMKYIVKYLEIYRNKKIIPDEQDVCVLNVCMKNSEKDLEGWMKERENRKMIDETGNENQMKEGEN